ncbi:hypothetical protein HYS03_00490 [Candidatus Woesebacteria bacterium]|nr:hypothetical protein [Candidatus Woesebacteria bacterium]QQG47632.1 MAG: hypothetical protein HY044_00920 [Candidatus Woesebacteria bacterium]
MKKLFFLFSLFAIFILIGSVNKISAASCSNFNVTPNSGQSDTAFTFTATCTQDGTYHLFITDPNGDTSLSQIIEVQNGQFTTIVSSAAVVGQYKTQLVFITDVLAQTNFTVNPGGKSPTCCSITYSDKNFCSNVQGQITQGSCNPVPSGSEACPENCPAIDLRTTCGGNDIWVCAGTSSIPQYLCAPNGTQKAEGVNTAIGCVPITKIEDTTSFLLVRGAQLAGGISFLFMIAGAFQLITSRGDPEKLISGRQLITSAIGGLVLLIFCVFLLKLIGIDILGVITK